MGMSTSIVGYRPADAKWQKMSKIWSDCKEAGVTIPKEVLDFFDGENPEGKPGMQVRIDDAVEEWNDRHRCASGFRVDLTKLPTDVKILIFFNSW